MIIAEHEIKFTQLFHFSSNLISIKERKTFHFQEGLSPFLKDKLSLLTLET